jgi:hypothetical protein
VNQVTIIELLHSQWSSKQHKNEIKQSAAGAIHLVAACLVNDHRGFMLDIVLSIQILWGGVNPTSLQLVVLMQFWIHSRPITKHS